MISEKEWRIDESTIAAIVPKEMLADRWFFEKKLNVRPGEVALWISNGKIVSIIEEGQTVSSGVFDRLKSKFGAGEDMFVMMLDTSERTLNLRVGLDKNAIKSSDREFYKKLEGIYNKDKEEVENKQKTDQGEEALHILGRIQEIRNRDLQEEEFKQAIKEAQAIPDENESRRVVNYIRLMWNIYGQGNEQSAIPTKDRESVIFEVRLIVSFLPEKSAEIYKLLKGYYWLLEGQLVNLIRNELVTKVFGPTISQYTAEELRGNMDILAELHEKSEHELFQWLSNYGIQLTRISINPAITDAERAAVIDKEFQAFGLAEEKSHKLKLAQAGQEYELELQKVKLAAQLDMAKAENDEEAQKIIRAAFLSEKDKELSAQEIDSKIAKIRLETDLRAKTANEKLRLYGIQKEWELDKEKMLAQAQIDLQTKTTETDLEIRKIDAAAQADISRMRVLAEEHRKNKAQKVEARIKEIETRRETALIEQQHTERLLEIGAQAKAIDGGVMTEALRQGTMRKALDQGERAAQAYSQAEGQRYAKENFQQGLSSAPNIGVAGQGKLIVQQIPGGQPQIPGPNPILNGSQDQTPGDQAVIIACAYCQKSVPADSKFCGYCGKSLQDEGD